MRIGVISDIHGNYAAMRTVLDEIGEVDSLWCLGDLVGYGPQPNECIEALLDYPHLCIPGNHDWGMLGKLNTDAFNRDAKYALDWTVKNIKPSNREYLENLPVTVKTFGQVFTMVHASPRDPMWEYLLDLFDAAECFPLFSSRYCFVGHTHVPLVFRDSTRRHLRLRPKLIVYTKQGVKDQTAMVECLIVGRPNRVQRRQISLW